jgi:acetyl-CoA C-acetyltransferase
MATTKEVVILSGARTAIGTFGGSLQSVPPTKLATLCAQEAIKRASIAPEEVEHSFFGNVIHTEPRDMYMARVAAVEAGVPPEAPALTVNRLCASGLEAIISATRAIQLGDAKIALAGGAESMSRGLYSMPGMRWGQRMGDGGAIDMVVGVLNDPFGHGHMGDTAENVAERWNVSRETQDEFALESQKRTARAIAEGRYKSQIVPVEIQDRKKTIVFDTDEHPRPDTTVETLAKLRPAFRKEGVVTAGNASGVNDGAAAVILMDADEAKARGLKPMARIVAYAHAGVEPSEMGIGPVPAVTKIFAKTGLSVDDMDLIESNEAFAAQACAVARELKFPADKTNPNGGAIALGHPIGATGAILVVKAMYELERTGGRYALITMCVGGGQGIAMIIERG